MLILSLAVLVVGWSVLWLVARHQAALSLAAWIAAEREQGRIWTCPDRRITGFPLGIVLSCAKPTFTEAGNASFHGEVLGLRAEAQLYFPTSVAIDLAGPLTVQDEAVDAELAVSWASARITLRGDLPGDLDRGQLEAEGAEITSHALPTPIRIGHGEVGFRPLTQKLAGPPDAELSLRATDIRNADADALLGSAEPMALRMNATLSRLPSRGASLPTLLEAWREAGGQLDLAGFSFTKSGFAAEGAGRLKLDDEHRLEGRFETRFTGLEPVAARFGLPMGAVQIGGFLSSLLGGKAGRTAPEPATVSLPLVARNGQLYLGPVKTGVLLPPLY